MFYKIKPLWYHIHNGFMLLCNEDYDIVILQHPLTEEAPDVEDTFKMVMTKCRYQIGNFNNF